MIRKELVFFNNKSISQDECLRFLVDSAMKINLINDKDAFLKAVYAREEEFSTAVGFNVAIPHGMSDAANESFIAFMKSVKPILWGKENTEVQLIFMIGVPQREKNITHLKFISQISKHLVDEKFREDLLNCKNEDEAFDYLNLINKSIEGA